MNVREARAQGLTFTGSYSSDNKGAIKSEAKRLRGLGFRAVVITETFKHRGGSVTGHSVYAEKGALKA